MRHLRLLGVVLMGSVLLCQIVLALTMSLAGYTGYRVMVITGGSMEPTYRLGSALLLKELPEGAVKVGDAVTYSSVEGTLTTHRVIDMPRAQGVQYLQTQGDANAEPDPNFVNAAAVIGTPVAHLPYGGYVTSFMFSPWGRLLVFGPPLAALLMVQVRIIRAVLGRGASKGTTHKGAVTKSAAVKGAVIGVIAWQRARPVPKHRARPFPVAAGRRRRLAVVPMVPMMVAILAGSGVAGVLVVHSTAMFTTVSHSTGSTFTTATTGPPVNLSATRSSSQNTVSWTAPAWRPTDGYRVFRAVKDGQPFTQIAQVTSGETSYVDSGGNPHSVYQVSSVSGTTVSVPAGPVAVR